MLPGRKAKIIKELGNEKVFSLQDMPHYQIGISIFNHSCGIMSFINNCFLLFRFAFYKHCYKFQTGKDIQWMHSHCRRFLSLLPPLLGRHFCYKLGREHLELRGETTLVVGRIKNCPPIHRLRAHLRSISITQPSRLLSFILGDTLVGSQ